MVESLTKNCVTKMALKTKTPTRNKKSRTSGGQEVLVHFLTVYQWLYLEHVVASLSNGSPHVVQCELCFEPGPGTNAAIVQVGQCKKRSCKACPFFRSCSRRIVSNVTAKLVQQPKTNSWLASSLGWCYSTWQSYLLNPEKLSNNRIITHGIGPWLMFLFLDVIESATFDGDFVYGADLAA